MDAPTMINLTKQAKEQAISKLPRNNSIGTAGGYHVGIEMAASHGAMQMFKLLVVERLPMDQLKDVIQLYEKTYGDAYQSLVNDLKSLNVIKS